MKAYRSYSEFEKELPAELDALRAALESEKVHAAGELDLSYESLDVVELLLTAALQNDPGKEARETLLERVAWYGGAALVRQTGGWWRMGSRSTGKPIPCVTRLPVLSAYEVYPTEIVKRGWIRQSRPWLRDGIEGYDLLLRREQAGRWLQSVDAEVARFGELLRAVLGLPAAPARDVASLELVQRGWVQVSAAPTTLEQLRAAREYQQGAVLHIGSLFLAELGRSFWRLCEVGARPECGELCADEWAPIRVLRGLSAKSPADGLRKAFDRELGARR